MSDTEQQRFVILDSNALIHRSYHALPDLSTKNGTQVNAVYGYVAVLLKVLRELQPTYIGAAFDLEGPTFRDEMYEAYKAQREKSDQALYDQIPLTKEVLNSFGIPVLTAEGYEADDVIGTIATRLNEEYPHVEVIIVTGDMDTMQLVNEQTKVFSLRKGVKDTVIYDIQGIQEKYGLNPDQVADFKGLKGDPSDNIPGVSGIGDKTAQKILAHFQDLDSLYETLNTTETYEELSEADKEPISKKVYTKLRQSEEQAQFSKELATINCEVPLDFALEEYAVEDFDRDTIAETLRSYEFESLISRLDEILGEDTSDSSQESASHNSDMLPLNQDIHIQEKCVIVPSEDDAYWILVNENGEATRISSLQYIASVIEDAEIQKIGHNLKPSIKGAWQEGLAPEGEWFDTRIAVYLLHAGEREYEFQKLLETYTSSKEHPWWQRMLELDSQLRAEIKTQSLEFILYNIELPLMHVLADMEYRGIYINQHTLYDIQIEVAHRIESLQETIFSMAGQEFNLDSPQQLSQVLFEDLGLPKKGLKKTSSGFISTSASTLEKLAGDYEIIDYILTYRELAKLQNTYIIPLADYADENSVIHTSFLQTVTATGRLSSANPNLQNIPHYSETGQKIRSTFQPRSGFVFGAFDYSQFELRLAAHLSQDEQMLEIFNSGTDFHSATAARMYGVSQDEISKQMRNNAKAINFGILYGMGVQALSQNLNVSRKEAQEYLDNYRNTFSTLIKYLESLKKKALERGYAETEYGRRRDLSRYNTKDPRQKAAMERIAINMPIQGLQADIIKLAMIQLHEQYKQDPHVHMLLQVHDELVFEIEESHVQTYTDEIQRIMTSVYEASIPLPVEAEISNYWK